jgi:hypothetical protein
MNFYEIWFLIIAPTLLFGLLLAAFRNGWVLDAVLDWNNLVYRAAMNMLQYDYNRGFKTNIHEQWNYHTVFKSGPSQTKIFYTFWRRPSTMVKDSPHYETMVEWANKSAEELKVDAN